MKIMIVQDSFKIAQMSAKKNTINVQELFIQVSIIRNVIRLHQQI